MAEQNNKKSHDEVLQRIGGFGSLAKFATFTLVMAIQSGDLIVNNLAFFELNP